MKDLLTNCLFLYGYRHSDNDFWQLPFEICWGISNLMSSVLRDKTTGTVFSSSIKMYDDPILYEFKVIFYI